MESANPPNWWSRSAFKVKASGERNINDELNHRSSKDSICHSIVDQASYRPFVKQSNPSPYP
jgi:hypothetical protein